MKPQNDTTKGHKEMVVKNLRDIYQKTDVLDKVFRNNLEKSFFIYAQKIEKVTAAIYLVTDVMIENLPLTQSLRQVSIDLLTLSYHAATQKTLDEGQRLTQVLVTMEQLISLITIGKIAHHISEMNADVLIHEISKMITIISIDIQDSAQRKTGFHFPSRDSSVYQQPIIAHENIDDELFNSFEKNRKKQNDIKDILKDVPLLKVQPSPSPLGGEGDLKKVLTQASRTREQSDVIKKTSTISHEKFSPRSQEIINVIKSHKNTTIADIQKYVTQWSSKTIQREIQDLVTKGLIRKEGDKRWATYHMTDKKSY